MSNHISDEDLLSLLASDERLLSISAPVLLPSSQTECLLSAELSPTLEKQNNKSKYAKKKAKNRERMREFRRSEKKEKKILQYQVELLKKQLHRILSVHESNLNVDPQTVKYPHNALSTNRHPDLWRVNLMREYVQLIAMGEKLRLENEQLEESLYKVWGRYTNFINLQLQNFYGSTLSPTAPLSVNHYTQYTVYCLPTPPDRMKWKNLNSKGNGQWISFAFNPNGYEDESDKKTFFFRESTNDVYFRPLSESICRKLQAEGYKEGVSFTKVMEQEVKSGKYHVINEMDHFGWKVTYYQITTQEAYPNLTHVVDLEANENKGFSDNMMRFDFVKRCRLKSHEDFDSIFTRIRESTWKTVQLQITSAGLRFSMDCIVGRVLQTINDDTCIALRSYISKKLPLISILTFMAHQYKNEVIANMFNPHQCISRSDNQDIKTLKDSDFSKKYSAEVFWVTHGHLRFAWYEVGDREYEIRYGGTILLREYTIDAKILEFSELVSKWEKYVFKEPTNPGK